MRLACLVALLLIPGFAGPAWAKPKSCFSATELTAEREVRHGIFLREAARRCQGRFLPNSRKMWETFEEANATRFRGAVAKRMQGWRREFPDDWQVKQIRSDGQIVTYARNQAVTPGFCSNVDDLLQANAKRGYGGFSAQAKTIRNEVVEDYKQCQ